MSCPFNSSRGFTLLELVIVMAIAGAAFAIAAVSIGRSHEKTLLRQETAKVQRMLRYARDLSLTGRVPVSFKVNTDEGTYWIESKGNAAIPKKNMREGFSIKGKTVVFFPLGNCTGGTMTITDSKKRGFAIEVDPVTGAAKVMRFQPS